MEFAGLVSTAAAVVIVGAVSVDLVSVELVGFSGSDSELVVGVVSAGVGGVSVGLVPVGFVSVVPVEFVGVSPVVAVSGVPVGSSVVGCCCDDQNQASGLPAQRTRRSNCACILNMLLAPTTVLKASQRAAAALQTRLSLRPVSHLLANQSQPRLFKGH